MRIGHGYDVHRLVPGRDLILGGVHVPFEKGLLGHSDADVLIHAIIDALLGAACLGDIGSHFPNSPEYMDISSLVLLQEVRKLLGDYVICSIDSTIAAEKPKLAQFIPKMRVNIESALGLEDGAVSIKATTEEGLGFTGTGEGISAHAVCLVRRRSQ